MPGVALSVLASDVLAVMSCSPQGTLVPILVVFLGPVRRFLAAASNDENCASYFVTGSRNNIKKFIIKSLWLIKINPKQII